MAFIDELTIRARSGSGGNGVVRWLHLKGVEFAGPSGGNGGSGGNVYFRPVRDIGILARYTGRKEFAAGRGGDGEKNSRHGKDGEDITIDVPVGSVVTNTATGETWDLTEEGKPVLALRGGRGGLGNEYFKSSTNKSPRESTSGKRGEEAVFYIELKLIVDAGFVGLPNAGKSSLMNALTGARAKVGEYPFTTLDPNLGVLYGYVLADIPGLIEGAAAGKGLGHKFLRHIARTRVLLHCISLEHEDPALPYETIRAELAEFDRSLLKKQEVVIFTKTDLVSDEVMSAREHLMRARGLDALSVTVLDDSSVKRVRDELVSRFRKQ